LQQVRKEYHLKARNSRSPKVTRGCHINQEEVNLGDLNPKNPKARSVEVSKTHGTHPSVVVIAHDVKPPRQIREIVLQEILLLSIQSSQAPKLAPSLNMVKRILGLEDG
jgi:hypothetical protein